MRSRHILRRSLWITSVALALGVCSVNASGQRSDRPADPADQSGTIRFSSGKSARGIKFQLINNLVLVQARINNSALSWFIFDTGATNTVIDTKRAQVLGLKASGRIVGTGSSASVEAARVRNVLFSFPGLEVPALTVYTVPVESFSPALGLPLTGVIGNDIIGRAVVEIDYQNAELNFFDRAGYRYEGKGESFPITLQERLPMLRGSFELKGHSFAGIFEIDTGSTGSVNINSPFARQHQLNQLVGSTKTDNLGGVGGSARAAVARFESFSLGSFRLSGPIGRLSEAKSGDYASRNYDGLIGGQIFRRFKLVVDLQGQRVIFEPNDSLNEPFEEDMSGMELVADGEDFATYLIDDVDSGSPANEAGVLGGDILKAIDNRPASDFTLEQIRRLFMKPGREYSLTLKRGEQTISLKLKLKRLV
jgi:Aspartyl protease/PDZ domain